ncbi:hypothetical protein NKH77_07775 [Streptomyces sp. M19]
MADDSDDRTRVRRFPQQRRLWSRSPRFGPHRGAQLWMTLDGPLDRDRLRAALSVVTRRHESLRTSLAVGAGRSEPAQVIDEPVDVELRTTEVTPGRARCPPRRWTNSAPWNGGGGPGPGRGSGAARRRRRRPGGPRPHRARPARRPEFAASGRRGAGRRVRGRRGGAARGGDRAVRRLRDLAQRTLTAEEGAAERAAWADLLTRADAGDLLVHATPVGERRPDPRTYRPDPVPAAAALDALATANGLDADSVLDAVFRVAVWRVTGEGDCLVLLTSRAAATRPSPTPSARWNGNCRCAGVDRRAGVPLRRTGDRRPAARRRAPDRPPGPGRAGRPPGRRTHRPRLLRLPRRRRAGVRRRRPLRDRRGEADRPGRRRAGLRADR